jgi:hypothetical protein
MLLMVTSVGCAELLSVELITTEDDAAEEESCELVLGSVELGMTEEDTAEEET